MQTILGRKVHVDYSYSEKDSKTLKASNTPDVRIFKAYDKI